MLDLQSACYIFRKMCNNGCDKCPIYYFSNGNSSECAHWILTNPLIAESVLRQQSELRHIDKDGYKYDDPIKEFFYYQTPKMRLQYLQESLSKRKVQDLTLKEIEAILNNIYLYTTYPCISEVEVNNEIELTYRVGSLSWVKQKIATAIQCNKPNVIILINMNDYKEVQEYISQQNYTSNIIQLIKDNQFAFIKIEFK